MKITLFTIFTFFTIVSSFSQTQVAGAEFPETFAVDETSLNLNGVGVREKFWIDLYAAGLYTSKRINDSETVINIDAPILIKIHIVSGLISSDKMSSAVEDGFEKSTQGNTSAYRAKIDKFKSFFSAEITKNDVFDITYAPSQGTVVFKNDKKQGTIKGLDFKKALFGIWFSEKPADKDLKEDMLNS